MVMLRTCTIGLRPGPSMIIASASFVGKKEAVMSSAQIFLLGAEFTWVYARTFGSMRGIAIDPLEIAPARSEFATTAPPVRIDGCAASSTTKGG
jgi:hypothetical protein